MWAEYFDVILPTEWFKFDENRNVKCENNKLLPRLCPNFLTSSYYRYV